MLFKIRCPLIGQRNGTEICAHLFLNRTCLENGDTLFIACPANLKIRCFEFCVVKIIIFVGILLNFPFVPRLPFEFLLSLAFWRGVGENLVANYGLITE